MDPSRKALSRQRQQFRDQLSANDNEDDPLDAYDRFVQWTIQNYGEDDPESGLVDLLEDATRKFKDDPSYKTDLRYLRLWTLYARKVDDPATIYAFLLASGIGTTYSLLYEEYANTLEQSGFYSEADNMYRLGINRNPRALSRLKSRFEDFQKRVPSSAVEKSKKAPSASHVPAPQSEKVPQNHQKSIYSSNTSPSSRYAIMLAPPVPGKRSEKLRFNLSLLFTEEGKEYSVQEARARSMGLLGKKWGPPPASEINHGMASSSSVQVLVKDDHRKADRNTTTRTRGFEPTVTINTKAALADVFGMFNSPEKTVRSAQIPGSKHAPLKKLELPAPVVRPPQVQASNENANQVSRTPIFRPYVDESNDRKENSTPAPPKFKPFVDSETPNRLPSTTPDNRRVLSVKDPGTLSSNSNENSVKDIFKFKPPAVVKPAPEDDNLSNVFTRVFTPAAVKPVRDLRKDDPKQSQSRSLEILSPTPASTNTLRPPPASSTANSVFTPFVDIVFTRPENTPSSRPKPFTPFSASRAATSASRTVLGTRPPSQSPDVIEIEDEDQASPDTPVDNVEETTEGSNGYEDAESFQPVPLGGRFGPFNVMTPITERTFEFTTGSRRSASCTPSEGPSMIDSGRCFGQQDEHDALEAAERLAAELRQEEERGDVYSLSQDSFDESDSSIAPVGDDSLPPRHAPTSDAALLYVEEKTGALSLIDALTVSSQFKPPNPCNPFDPPILLTLLSLFPSDEDYHFFRDREANMLDGLRKFAKRARKTSGDSTSTGVFNLSSCLSIALGDRRFDVSGKLGEGGFGTVFQAKVLGNADDENEDDECEDDDEDGSSMVALKVVKPRNIWEYHVLRRLHSALPAHLRRSVILPRALYAFRDESILILDLCPQGTLLDIVNNAGPAGVSQQGACLDELLVIFFSIELLRLVEGMHSAGFIHGDLKIDNCLLRLEDVPGGASAWSALYQTSGKGGWVHKGIKLIDFGRTIDTRLFPVGQKFIAEWPTDDRDCFEMREMRPWTFQTDYFGLAGIIYCMLFGKYIQNSSVTNSPEGYKITTPFKRYWQSDLWNRLFHVLLNPCLVRPDGQLPVNEELGALRQEMEVWLQANCNRSSNTLKGLLKKVEVSVWRGSSR